MTHFRDSEPVVMKSDEVAELERRWKAIVAGQATVPHDDVVRWLRSWGTPEFKAWRD